MFLSGIESLAQGLNSPQAVPTLKPIVRKLKKSEDTQNKKKNPPPASAEDDNGLESEINDAEGDSVQNSQEDSESDSLNLNAEKENEEPLNGNEEFSLNSDSEGDEASTENADLETTLLKNEEKDKNNKSDSQAMSTKSGEKFKTDPKVSSSIDPNEIQRDRYEEALPNSAKVDGFVGGKGSGSSTVDEEERIQRKILERKNQNNQPISESRDQDRYPTPHPIFKLPPGPKGGGTVRIPHPRANDGLLSVSSTGMYQYKTPKGNRSKSASFKVGFMTPPYIESENPEVSYESMYGNTNLSAFLFDYEWHPLTHYKNWGLVLGGGISVATGNGFFAIQNGNRESRAQEKYTFFMLPLSASLRYRFEYSDRQWLVPYVTGGMTAYGLVELRDDNTSPNLAVTGALGGGGGILLPISRLDSYNAFVLSTEYGISDMWLAVEGIVQQGLSAKLDFSNQQINVGIHVDF